MPMSLHFEIIKMPYLSSDDKPALLADNYQDFFIYE